MEGEGGDMAAGALEVLQSAQTQSSQPRGLLIHEPGDIKACLG